MDWTNPEWSLTSLYITAYPRMRLSAAVDMTLRGTRNCSGRRSWCEWLGWLFITVVIVLDASGTAGQQNCGPSTFQFGELSSGRYGKSLQVGRDDLTCHGAFVIIDGSSASDNIDILTTSYYGYPNDILKLSPWYSGTSGVSGRCLYEVPVQLVQSCAGRNSVTSFSTMFQIYILISPRHPWTPQGLAFIIASDDTTQGEAGGYLGWLDSTTNGQSSGHNFAVELDFFRNMEFDDPVGVHVGVNVNTLTSVKTAGYAGLVVSEESYLPAIVWIDYDGQTLNVTVHGNNDAADLSDYLRNLQKPTVPLISTKIDLSKVLSQDNMFVGFSGAISNGTLPANHSEAAYFGGFYITEWTFNSNGPAPDLPRNSDGTVPDPWLEALTKAQRKERARKILIASITVPSALVFLTLVYIISVLYRRISRLNALARKYQLEELEHLERGPQTFKYKALSTATKGFSSSELLGTGGFGSVYKGRLRSPGAPKQSDIAVKRISATSHQGAREFLAEIKIIGRVQHRNLVRLLGWCHERGELLLVYEYMPNGSVDQHLFKDKGNVSGEPVLTWARRLKIVSGVATALAYLHEEWEQRVIHRDVKSSNIMLDGDFNARLGDFGLARLSEHDQVAPSTVLAGTQGYLAPELGHTLKATEKTDVYSFGAVVLEVATGKRPLLPLEDRRFQEQVLLVDLVWGLYRDGILLAAADSRLESAFDSGEMVTLLKIGLLCCHPDPDERPNMREVLNIWKGSSLFPPLPLTKPVPTFLSNLRSVGLDDSDADTAVMISMEDYGRSIPLEERSSALDYADDKTQMIPIENDDLAIAPWDHEQSQGWRGSLSSPRLRSRQWKSSALPM